MGRRKGLGVVRWWGYNNERQRERLARWAGAAGGVGQVVRRYTSGTSSTVMEGNFECRAYKSLYCALAAAALEAGIVLGRRGCTAPFTATVYVLSLFTGHPLRPGRWRRLAVQQ